MEGVVVGDLLQLPVNQPIRLAELAHLLAVDLSTAVLTRRRFRMVVLVHLRAVIINANEHLERFRCLGNHGSTRENLPLPIHDRCVAKQWPIRQSSATTTSSCSGMGPA